MATIKSTFNVKRGQRHFSTNNETSYMDRHSVLHRANGKCYLVVKPFIISVVDGVSTYKDINGNDIDNTFLLPVSKRWTWKNLYRQQKIARYGK